MLLKTLNQIINDKGNARLILATGTSQFYFLEQLQKEVLPWDKITVFHLDEYVGIADNHPASFRKYLKTRILDHVKPKKVFYLNGDAHSIHNEIKRYSNALSKHPINLACIGIGENGHLAFNDPGVANFNDSQLVKSVFLDQKCRQQQYNEGWFDTLEAVPKEALTLTIKAIMNVEQISCIAPETRKSKSGSGCLGRCHFRSLSSFRFEKTLKCISFFGFGCGSKVKGFINLGLININIRLQRCIY